MVFDLEMRGGDSERTGLSVVVRCSRERADQPSAIALARIAQALQHAAGRHDWCGGVTRNASPPGRGAAPDPSVGSRRGLTGLVHSPLGPLLRESTRRPKTDTPEYSPLIALVFEEVVGVGDVMHPRLRRDVPTVSDPFPLVGGY